MSPTITPTPFDRDALLLAAVIRRRDALAVTLTTPPEGCDNITLLIGRCNDLPVCGYCYDYGQLYKPSREYEIFNLTVIGVLLPMLGVLGLVGNCVNAFVFTRRRMQSSLNAYLCALAFSDMTIVFTSFFLFFLENMRKRSSSIRVSKCYAVLAPVMFPLGLTAQTLSVFLTLAGAFDCFVLVAAGGSLRRRCCTMATSKRVITGIIVASCLFNLPHIFEITVIDCWSLPYNQPGYDVCPTDLRQNETYYKWYYAYLYTIVMAAGPVLLLIVLNTTIILSMRKKYNSIATNIIVSPRKKSTPALPEYGARQRRRHSMRERRRLADGLPRIKYSSQQAGAPPPKILSALAATERRKSAAPGGDYGTFSSPPAAKPKETADVMTLVLVVFLFISCNIMPLTVNFLELLFNLVNAYLIDLSNLMVVLNSSCNFIIYYVFCESYRLTLHKYFRKIRHKTFAELFALPKRRAAATGAAG